MAFCFHEEREEWIGISFLLTALFPGIGDLFGSKPENGSARSSGIATRRVPHIAISVCSMTGSTDKPEEKFLLSGAKIGLAGRSHDHGASGIFPASTWMVLVVDALCRMIGVTPCLSGPSPLFRRFLRPDARSREQPGKT